MESLQKEEQHFDTIWLPVMERYEILENLGEGSYGKVVKARERKSGKIFAIKMIQDVLASEQHARHVCRELKIMRATSKHDDNIYTVKLHDVIVAKVDNIGQESTKISQNKCDFKTVFLVEEYFGLDL